MSNKTADKALSKHWERHSAIERCCGVGHNAVVEVGDGDMSFDRNDSFDYFLVNTNEFMPLAQKGSVLEVWTSDAGLKDGNIVLVINNNRMEIQRYKKGKHFQILGLVDEVRQWPGKSVRNWCL